MVYKHSEETKRKIGKANSIAMKRFWKNNPEHKNKLPQLQKGRKAWNKGKKHSKEHIENSRLAHIGYKHSEETKRKMREKVSWNKGKTYEEFFGEKKAKDMKKKMSEKRKGIKLSCNGWNKGLKMSNKHKKNHKLAMEKFRGGNNQAKKLGVRKKISIAKTGKKFPIDKYPNMGVRKFRHKLKIPKKDTSIEVKIQNFLKELKIEFFTHQYMKIEHGYQCDIFVPSFNLVIEADGDYFHGNPNKYSFNELNKRQVEQKERDNIRTKELLEKGYNVIRIWENEIRLMNINDFKNKLMEVII